MAFNNILVPVDFTETSRAALRLARDLAAETGATLTVLHVSVPTVAAAQPGPAHPSGGMGVLYEDLRKQIVEGVQASLAQLREEELGEGAPSYQLRIRQGQPAAEVLAQVQDGGHDLVVMGTHGRKGLRRALLGSVAEQVLRDASVPVLLTRS